MPALQYLGAIVAAASAVGAHVHRQHNPGHRHTHHIAQPQPHPQTGSDGSSDSPTASMSGYSTASQMPAVSGSLTNPVAINTGSPSPVPSTTSPANGSSSDVIRGVNIGGWLVLESWMTPETFEGTGTTDQWTFDQQVGTFPKLQQHWETYFTEADVKRIAGWGINALRLPIGYWAYNNEYTPYQKGADVYLERAIGWARNAGLKVLIDLHGAPGSQNGFDNSGHALAVHWQKADNMDRTISVLETITKKYGCRAYADVVIGVELVNEPISWDPLQFNVTQAWTSGAYDAVRAVATNPNLQIVMHDSFTTPYSWTELASTINGNVSKDAAPFAIDTHLYQNQVDEDSTLTQAEHIKKACNWTNSDLLPLSYNTPVYVGEWSASTNVCANPNGTTVAGLDCNGVEGCQCTWEDMADWKEPLITATRKYVEAQMDAFEHSTQGWYIWSYKAPGSWGLENVMQYLYAPGEKIGHRRFGPQCQFNGTV